MTFVDFSSTIDNAITEHSHRIFLNIFFTSARGAVLIRAQNNTDHLMVYSSSNFHMEM